MREKEWWGGGGVNPKLTKFSFGGGGGVNHKLRKFRFFLRLQ